MTLDGLWDAVVKSPVGAQKFTLTLTTDGNRLTGDCTAEGGTAVPLQNGKIDGSKMSWTMDITKPMALKLDISASWNGDTIEGVAKLGIFGKFPFVAARQG